MNPLKDNLATIQYKGGNNILGGHLARRNLFITNLHGTLGVLHHIHGEIITARHTIIKIIETMI